MSHTVNITETEIWNASLTIGLSKRHLGYRVHMVYECFVPNTKNPYYKVTFKNPEDETMFRLCCLTPRQLRQLTLVSPGVSVTIIDESTFIPNEDKTYGFQS